MFAFISAICSRSRLKSIQSLPVKSSARTSVDASSSTASPAVQSPPPAHANGMGSYVIPRIKNLFLVTESNIWLPLMTIGFIAWACCSSPTPARRIAIMLGRRKLTPPHR